MRAHKYAAGALLAGILLIATSAWADTCRYQLPQNWQQQWQTFSEGTLKHWGFKVYDAALWRNSTQAFSFNQSFALSLCYRLAFEGTDIVKQTLEELRGLELIKAADEPHVARAFAFFPNVKKGDTLTGVFYPNQRAQFYFNQQPVGQVEPDLAHAFFRIWLDEKTSAPALRKQLLEQRDAN